MRGENDPLPRRLKCALVFFLELTAGLPSGRTAICLIASISWSKGSHWLDAALNWVTSMSGRKSKQGLYLAAGSNESWPDFPLARHGNLIRLMPPLHVDSSDSIVLTSTVQTSGSSYPFCEAAHKPPPLHPSIHPHAPSHEKKWRWNPFGTLRNHVRAASSVGMSTTTALVIFPSVKANDGSRLENKTATIASIGFLVRYSDEPSAFTSCARVCGPERKRYSDDVEHWAGDMRLDETDVWTVQRCLCVYLSFCFGNRTRRKELGTLSGAVFFSDANTPR